METSTGKVHSGLLIEKTDKEVVLKNAKNELVRIAADEIDQMRPQRKSMMPDLLLRELTAQQVADLLSYLQRLK
ncbi:MAG: hypothetical protein IH991_22305 [Planctomycetes bacterium]|nr:hypothetical protein [Planctomycetota bacterium]